MNVKGGTPTSVEVDKILLNGEDVTSNCYEADDESGTVLLGWNKPRGGLVRCYGNVVKVRKHGEVVIVLKPVETVDNLS